MTNSPEVDLIVRQYRAVVGALDNMFKEMSSRSEVMLWMVDGIGTCRNATREISEYKIVGSARDTLIALRDERNKQIPGMKGDLTECPYYRAGSGCVLGDLKGPYCIAYVDSPFSLRKFFKIDGDKLRDDIDLILLTILLQDTTLQFTQTALQAISTMTAYVTKHRMLDPQDRRFRNSIRRYQEFVGVPPF